MVPISNTEGVWKQERKTFWMVIFFQGFFHLFCFKTGQDIDQSRHRPIRLGKYIDVSDAMCQTRSWPSDSRIWSRSWPSDSRSWSRSWPSHPLFVTPAVLLYYDRSWSGSWPSQYIFLVWLTPNLCSTRPQILVWVMTKPTGCHDLANLGLDTIRGNNADWMLCFRQVKSNFVSHYCTV